MFSKVGALASIACLVLASYITERAAEAEKDIVRATRIALTISQSGDHNDPRWAPAKREMLELIRKGTEINPHYRKITPMVADELARWGDWKNATWIWESVLSSRPHIVAILSNAARGYASTGQTDKARELLERARKLQPRASSVRSLEIILLSRAGREPEALALARQSLADGVVDFDLLVAAAQLGQRAGDFSFAIQAIEQRAKAFPETAQRGYMQIGFIYASDLKDDAAARRAFSRALEITPEPARAALLGQVPAHLRPALPAAGPTAPATGQMSASKL